MNFTRENLDAVLSGYKTQTRRFTDTYQVGKTYAACPGRGKKGEGRILIKRKWQEQLQDISEKDAAAELGYPYDGTPSYRRLFHYLWDSIYGDRLGKRWADNPHPWAYEFELVIRKDA